MSIQPIYVTKADGKKELFDTGKLQSSLLRAGASSKSVQEILNAMTDSATNGITTHQIYQQAFGMLQSHNTPVALKYSIKRAVMELGPSGFPFEDFVAEIFRAQGYEAVTGQIVRGFCVEHEIDVVAWNDEKMIMVEAKFHNTLGIRSDLKVALYVKARFDDLRKMKFTYGGRERELDEGWLVTNTKFTSTAIEYGSCQGGLTMIGWNYPPHGNLHDMILEAKLHPLTCLASMNGMQKKMLLDQGVVLCKTITDNPQLLEAIGMKEEERNAVMEEIAGL
jgi:hypothetical protein